MTKIAHRTCGRFCAAGFTLVELAVVLVIVGLLSASLIGAYSLYMKKAQVGTTQDNIAEAKKALYQFQSQNGHFPCPASPTGLDAREDCSSVTTVTAPNGEEVMIGVLPVYNSTGNTMLVSQQGALDGYGRRLTYAITKQMATGGTYASGKPSIQIRNMSTGTTSDETFAIISHGPDGRGAYTPKGKLVKDCNTSSKDGQNCDFVTDHTSNAAIFVDTANNRSTAAGVNTADDFVGSSTVAMATMKCADDEELRGYNPTTGVLLCEKKEIRCTNPGEAFIGVKDRAAVCGKLNKCAAGYVLAEVDPHNNNSPSSCVPNMPGSCSPNEVQYGIDPETGKPACIRITSGCGYGAVQVGMDGNFPICAAANNFNNLCPGIQVQVGNNSDGTPNCITPSCPGGYYFAGLDWNRQPICSRDQGFSDLRCGGGEVMVGISNNAPICEHLNIKAPVGRLYGGGGNENSFYCEGGYHKQCYHFNVGNTNNAFFCECHMD